MTRIYGNAERVGCDGPRDLDGIGEGPVPHTDSPSSHASWLRSVRRRTEAHKAISSAMEAWDEPWVETLAFGLSVNCALEDVDISRAQALVEKLRKLLDDLDPGGIPDDGGMAQGVGSDGVVLSTDGADAPDVNRGELAARLFGSSHALDDDTTLARWVTAALRLRLGENGEGLDRRQLWEASGIRDSQVSARR